MNIFALDINPETAAQYHCNKHVVKMIIESYQMLIRQYVTHPCTRWTWRSLDNWVWLQQLAIALCEEYTLRYSRIHFTETRIRLLNLPTIRSKGLTPFEQCMPYQYWQDDSILAYRQYYIHEKRRFARWAVREVPPWFKI